MLPPIRPVRTLARANDLRCRIRAHRELTPGDPFDDLAEEYLTFTIDHLKLPEHSIGLHPCVTTWQWTHGDVHSRNVIFGPTGSLTMIDWDRARVQPRLFELIRSIVLWLADIQTGHIDLQAAWSMMRGYAAWVRVEPGVLSDIVDYFWWSKLNDLWILDRHYVQADPVADDLLAPTLQWLRWLLEHRTELAEALDEAAHVDSGPSST
jgi:thiamine kinase-like enzyme